MTSSDPFPVPVRSAVNQISLIGAAKTYLNALHRVIPTKWRSCRDRDRDSVTSRHPILLD